MSIGQLPRELGRYDLFDKIAAGGMATVHFGRLHGAVGFQRVVAIKRLHAHYAHDAHFVDMFLDEARLASRLKHPNVIQTLDVVADEKEVFLVMEFVLGESLETLMPRVDGHVIPLSVVASIVCNVLEGLHGAHEATSDTGEALGIVHRDVSPPNVLVGSDGIARVFDFGIAKAAINTQETRDGVIKGKVTYMAPEQVKGGVDRRADLYAVGIILWELLVARRRHAGQRNDELFLKLATNALEPLRPASQLRRDAPPAIDAVIARATATNPEDRFATAREMAMAIESVLRPAPAREVAEWLQAAAGARIDRLAEIMKRIESDQQPRSEPSLSIASSRGVPASSLTGPGVASSVPPGATTGMIQYSSSAPRSRRNWTMPAALLAFLVALLAVGLRVYTGRGGEVRARPDANAAALAGPVPPEALPTTVVTATGASVDAALVPGSGTAGSAGTATASVGKAPPWSPPARAVVPQHPSSPAAAPVINTPVTPTQTSAPAVTAHKASCDNPFVVGADGIRQIKPECM
ncbi:MAG: serine/threonine protein kinase [Labilithrix sp.]|nr:serine/threonine protein kinase [Labilithrix sp.]